MVKKTNKSVSGYGSRDRSNGIRSYFNMGLGLGLGFAVVEIITSIIALAFFDNKSIQKNEILLEYIENSKTLGDDFTEKNCKQWGAITKKIHSKKFSKCFRYDENGEKVELTWLSYLESKINKAFTKLLISHKSLQHFVDNNNIEFKNEDDIHKENFIKFLSDSRDWSFEYIENVQSKINKMILDLKPDVEYFEKFGLLYDGHPSYPMLTNFIKSYKELQDLLPKEDYK